VMIYSDIVGQATVCSLSAEKAREVVQRIAPWPADQFGGFSTVMTFRPETARRVAARTHPRAVGRASDLVEIRIECLAARKLRPLPPAAYPYRFELKERLPSGEPIFEWIPPFLLKKV
jgi:hypothetical protein